MRERAQNDRALERQVPVFQIFDIAGHAVFNVGVIPGFATKSAHLRETGDARLHKSADVIVGQEFRELLVVFD